MAIGERCKCQRRIDYDIQCEHELKIISKFNHLHYNHRWLNNVAFNEMCPGLVPKPSSTNEGVLTIIGDNSNVPIIHTEPIIDVDKYDDTRVIYQ